MRLLRSFKVQAEKLAAKAWQDLGLEPDDRVDTTLRPPSSGRPSSPGTRLFPPGEAQEIRGFRDAPLGP